MECTLNGLAHRLMRALLLWIMLLPSIGVRYHWLSGFNEKIYSELYLMALIKERVRDVLLGYSYTVFLSTSLSVLVLRLNH